MTAEEIARVETLVNEQILLNTETVSEVLPIKEAQTKGATMLFGEKYGEIVRVCTIGNSIEFCGGTHVRRTGDIGSFKIIGECGISAGVRRIEGITGMNAVRAAQENAGVLAEAALRFNAKATELPAKIDDMMANMKALEKQLEQLKSKMASSMGDSLVAKAVDVKGIKLLVARLDGADAKALRETMDKVKDKLGTAVAVLASVNAEGRVQLAAGVTRDLTNRVKAGELVNVVAGKLGGKGGGKPDMAMAGAQNADGLDAALADVNDWVAANSHDEPQHY
ncbi:alanyl-tRNA synthetase [gut metagenome]|uniref:Alanine--tRNA ligase n=1 Tax=gut metagenome TaxID=749906 RepID=J9G5P8_9ZZZZ